MAEDKDNTGQPSHIGPYRILDVLGEGGMAVVYLAEQSKPVKRRVALKIVKLGMDSKQVVARFESERQVLAVLDHPNIAKIFDGGITDSGRPYFVMERVHGIPITDYCDQHKLHTNERIELFARVCSAVQHAHHKGLVHRDIKPSNLLVGVVDGKPQVKIIDFGIAKATGTSFTDSTLVTKIGQVIGTPQYMSPEQADMGALDIDTRSDIYSLGVVLYELLAGVVPLDLHAIGDQAIRVALRERDPAKPSTRITELGDTIDEIAKARGTDPGHLQRELKGDLDWVVMRAIEKDRTRRYETANALAMDCKRFLDHEPVLARPPSTGYVLSRFVRRNRTMVAAASVALLAIIVGAVAATIGFVRATEAEQVARREAETAREVSTFLTELFEVSDPSEARGNSILAREILDAGAARIRTELSAQPQVQAALMNTIGTVYSKIGLYDSARPQLESALEKSEAEYGRRSLPVAWVLFGLGELHRYLSNFDEAEKLHRESLAIRQEILGEKHEFIAESLHATGVTLYYLANYEEAELLERQALDMYVDLVGEDDARVAGVLSSLGSLMHNTDRYAEAEENTRRALQVFRSVFGNNHPNVATNLNDLGLILEQVGRLEEAQAAFEESLEVFRIVYPPDHEFTAETQVHLAGLMNSMGNVDRAESLFRDSIASLERNVGHNHMLTMRAMDSFGVMLFSRGRFDEAAPIISEAVELHKIMLGERHIDTARSMNNMAALLFLTGDYAGAEPYFRDSLSIRTEHLGDKNADVANSKNNLADLLNRLGRYDEAEPLAAEAAATYEAVFSATHWRAAVARNIHGASLAGLGRLDEAEALLIESSPIIAEARNGSIYHRMALQRTIDLYEQRGQPEKAAPFRDELACVSDPAQC